MRLLVQLVYASAPSAIGGALITALGLGKKQTTTFEKPDIIVNQGDAPCCQRPVVHMQILQTSRISC